MQRQDWLELFGQAFSTWSTRRESIIVAAVIDRVTFNAHIIETGTESYRHGISRTRRRSRRDD